MNPVETQNSGAFQMGKRYTNKKGATPIADQNQGFEDRGDIRSASLDGANSLMFGARYDSLRRRRTNDTSPGTFVWSKFSIPSPLPSRTRGVTFEVALLVAWSIVFSSWLPPGLFMHPVTQRRPSGMGRRQFTGCLWRTVK